MIRSAKDLCVAIPNLGKTSKEVKNRHFPGFGEEFASVLKMEDGSVAAKLNSVAGMNINIENIENGKTVCADSSDFSEQKIMSNLEIALNIVAEELSFPAVNLDKETVDKEASDAETVDEEISDNEDEFFNVNLHLLNMPFVVEKKEIPVVDADINGDRVNGLKHEVKHEAYDDNIESLSGTVLNRQYITPDIINEKLSDVPALNGGEAVQEQSFADLLPLTEKADEVLNITDSINSGEKSTPEEAVLYEPLDTALKAEKESVLTSNVKNEISVKNDSYSLPEMTAHPEEIPVSEENPEPRLLKPETEALNPEYENKDKILPETVIKTDIPVNEENSETQVLNPEALTSEDKEYSLKKDDITVSDVNLKPEETIKTEEAVKPKEAIKLEEAIEPEGVFKPEHEYKNNTLPETVTETDIPVTDENSETRALTSENLPAEDEKNSLKKLDVPASEVNLKQNDVDSVKLEPVNESRVSNKVNEENVFNADEPDESLPATDTQVRQVLGQLKSINNKASEKQNLKIAPDDEIDDEIKDNQKLGVLNEPAKKVSAFPADRVVMEKTEIKEADKPVEADVDAEKSNASQTQNNVKSENGGNFPNQNDEKPNYKRNLNEREDVKMPSDNNDLDFDKDVTVNRPEFQDFMNKISEQRSGTSNASSKTQPQPQQTELMSRGRAAFTESVGNVVRFISTGGLTKATIIIDPPALGKVNIEIISADNGIETVLKVSNEQVKMLVQDQAAQLKQNLAQIGVNLAEFSVDIQQDDNRQRNQSFNNKPKKARFGRSTGTNESEDEKIEVFRVDLRKGLLHWIA